MADHVHRNPQSAADVALVAMKRLSDALPAGCDLILQVHDEFVVEAPEALADAVAHIMRRTMTEGWLEFFPDASTINLVEIKIVRCWGEAKGAEEWQELS